MLSVVTVLCWLMVAAGATKITTQMEIMRRPPGSSAAYAGSSRAAVLGALDDMSRRHPERLQRLLAAFAAAAAATSDKDGDGSGGGGTGTEFGPRVLRWESPSDAADFATPEGDDSADDGATEDMSPVFPSGTASKRGISVLSRWKPFTSLGNAGRRASRYPHRGRPIGGTRDFISAETRGDFGDRPIGQPMRWGRR